MIKFLRWLAATSKRPEAEIIHIIREYSRAMMIQAGFIPAFCYLRVTNFDKPTSSATRDGLVCAEPHRFIK